MRALDLLWIPDQFWHWFGALGWLLLARFRAKTLADNQTKDNLLEFLVKFPGRCPICAYHQYGFSHGHESKTKPEPHDCIEECKK